MEVTHTHCAGLDVHKKIDVQDAEWIADLLRHGLLRGSFIPPLVQRDLRDLTRQRITLVRERARVVNRLQKVLEWANIKLASVVTDITGVSARKMLQAIVDGQTDIQDLAQLAKGRLVRKLPQLEEALLGKALSWQSRKCGSTLIWSNWS
jgi:hypothetical protein